MGADSLSIQVIRTEQELESIKDEWDDLVARSGTTNPFLVWDWLATWHKHLARGPLYVLAARLDGQLVGVVPFEQVSYSLRLGLRVPTFQHIGRGTSQTEIRSLLSLPGYEAALVEAALSHLQQLREPWYCAVFDGLLSDSEAYRAITAKIDDKAEALRQDALPAYVLELPDSWEAFRSGLKRNIKESLRHCYNSLKREGHSYEFEIWEEPERLREGLDVFYQLHTIRASHESSVKHRLYFETPAELRFLYEVGPRLLERGILYPCFLRVNGEIVAARLTFVLGGQLYLYYSGFDTRWWKYSVATTITAECIKWAIQRGLRSVNLSTGTDVSKTRWGGRELEFRSVVALADGWLPKLALRTYAVVGRRDPTRWKRLFGAMPGGRLAASQAN